MPFYIIKQDTSIEGGAMVDSLPSNIDPLEWIGGESLGDQLKVLAQSGEIVLPLSLASGDYRGHIMDGLITLFHDELKEALTKLGAENIEYHPVRLLDQRDDTTEGGYWMVNIIGFYDCIDMVRSKHQTTPSGRGHDFESIVIDTSRTEGADIFRLQESPTLVVISEDLKTYFDETDMLVGVDLIKTEDFSDW